MSMNALLESEQHHLLSLEYCAEYANMTLECIALKREIQRVKGERRTHTKRHEKIKKYYRLLLSSEGFHMDRIIQGRNMLNKYTDAVKSLYQMTPTPYVLRKHAELIRIVRKQELLETYIRLKEKQNKELMEYLQNKRMNLIKGLFIQEERMDVVKAQLVQLLAKKVENLFYRQRYSATNKIRWNVPL
mmetsp:Transcript_29357/g.43335  ORF Transcript_29357/g.43335 Transcript_29357/m.43335 type:complete len:188 (+) Transcript_29357:75-638(+)